MRAVIHETFGEPWDVLKVEDLPTPEPGPGEVRVRTILSPVHNHDLWTIRGSYGFKPQLPARAGTEAVGIIDALGEGVEALTVGQRVASSGAFGVWAEYFIAQPTGLVPVDEGTDDEVAAQLVAMPFSTLALLDWLDLSEGDWLIQNAANGAVGRLLAQLAPARGINVLGLVRRDAGVDELADQGIDRVVSTETPGWEDRIAELTGGAQITAGIDSVGAEATDQVLSQLSEDATLVIFGAMAGGTASMSSGSIIFKNVTVRGFWGSRAMGSLTSRRRGELFTELLTRVKDGTLPLTTEAVYSLDQVQEAARANFAAGRAGKIMLQP